jgi:hypothetical protein
MGAVACGAKLRRKLQISYTILVPRAAAPAKLLEDQVEPRRVELPTS